MGGGGERESEKESGWCCLETRAAGWSRYHMWAAAGRVTQANYNSSNELVLGTLSLCDFRVKILTDVAPSPHSPRPSWLPPSVFAVCWNFLVYLGFLFSSFRFVRIRLALFVCLFICWLICSSSIIHNHMCLQQQQSERETGMGERERGGAWTAAGQFTLCEIPCFHFIWHFVPGTLNKFTRLDQHRKYLRFCQTPSPPLCFVPLVLLVIPG